jgi:ribosomal protein S14
MSNAIFLNFRYFIKKKELKLKFLRSLYLSENIKLSYIIKRISLFYLKTFNMLSYSSFCYYSNRSRGLIKNLGISRFIFRKFINLNYIEGFKKSTW